MTSEIQNVLSELMVNKLFNWLMEGSLPGILIEWKVNSSQACYTWTILPNPNVTAMPDILLSYVLMSSFCI